MGDSVRPPRPTALLGAGAAQGYETGLAFRSLLAYVTPHRGVLLLAVPLMVGESAIALANPWIAGRFTELVLQPADSHGVGLPALVTLWALLLAAQSGLSFGNQYLFGSTRSIGDSILNTDQPFRFGGTLWPESRVWLHPDCPTT